MINYATLEQAKNVVKYWGGLEDSVIHLGDFGNSVFKFQTKDGSIRIIRFTDSTYRSASENEGELEYLSFLKTKSAPTCYPIESSVGPFQIIIPSQNNSLLCSVLSFAPGEIINDASPYWTNDFFKEWGRNLASIHAASKVFKGERKRWVWDQEILFRDLEKLLPVDDVISRQCFSKLITEMGTFPKTADSFGMIHGDHAPQNFHYDTQTGRITAFDFGNCCYHWYMADLAIALSTIRFRSDREVIRNALLAGYSEIQKLPENVDHMLEVFMKLRILYVYLDRLHLFGQTPDAEQSKTLTTLQQRVHAQKGW